MKAAKGEKWDEWRKRASDWMFFDQAHTTPFVTLHPDYVCFDVLAVHRVTSVSEDTIPQRWSVKPETWPPSLYTDHRILCTAREPPTAFLLAIQSPETQTRK